MNKCKNWIIIGLMLAVMLAFIPLLLQSSNSFAKTKYVYYGNTKIGTYSKTGEIKFKYFKDGKKNYRYLTYLLALKGSKTIIIPKKSIYVDGPLYPSSNKTIIAKGSKLTFKKDCYAIFTKPNKHIRNLKIIGGTWRSRNKEGRTGSLFQITFATNVTLDGIDCNANYRGHTIEIIACNNLTVKNCTVNAIGSNPSDCKEEQIQIDLSTWTTAPRPSAYGNKYAQGQTCKNIYILNNTVKGARAVGINFTDSENGKFLDKYHDNIVIEGNNLTGTTSEGLTCFNVVGCTIRNNIITTNAIRTTSNSSYTIGVHLSLYGPVPTSLADSKIDISNNVIRGNRNGIYLKGCFNDNQSICIAKYGNVNISGNTIYCKNGIKNAIDQTKTSCKALNKSNNTLYTW